MTGLIDELLIALARVFLRDPAVVIEKLLIDTGGLQPSYLGPPQSQRLP